MQNLMNIAPQPIQKNPVSLPAIPAGQNNTLGLLNTLNRVRPSMPVQSTGIPTSVPTSYVPSLNPGGVSPQVNPYLAAQRAVAGAQSLPLNRNMIPGGPAIGWQPKPMHQIVAETNQLLKTNSSQNLLNNNSYFKKVYDNLTPELQNKLLATANMLNPDIEASRNNLENNLNLEVSKNYLGNGTSTMDFIASQEGFRSKAYPDYSQYSVGYGTKANNPNQVVSESEARNMLNNRIERDRSRLSQIATKDFNPDQWTGILSFAYNTGIGRATKLVNYLNNGEDEKARNYMHKFVKAGGKKLDSLINRRNQESNLIFGT
ncbi:MAG: lysozyme [Candidatus Thorarchaeota archaeon]